MTPKTSQSRGNQKIDNDTLNTLSSLGCDRLDDLLDHLGVTLYPGGKCYVGRCPVHGGRSAFGLNLYPDGYEARGYWECQSGKCHTHFPASLIGFVWGVLSHERCGWDGETYFKKVPYLTAVAFVLNFLGLDDIADVKVDRKANALRRLANDVDILVNKVAVTRRVLCSNEQLHKMIKTPAAYYLNRGFTPETLEKFEVGLVTAKGSQHYGRVLYPVYDPTGAEIIGAVSRSVHPKCDKCKACHDRHTSCPLSEDPAERLKHVRWRVVGEFKDKQHLYNLWNAKEHIQRTKCVVVVEGAGDVWRLHEAGVRNVVGLFGSNFSEAQKELLVGCIPRTVVILTDNDKAGNEAANQISDMITFANKVRLVPHEGQEVGDLSVNAIREHLVPQIEKYFKR